MATFLKTIASLVALGILLLHQFHPRVDIDAISLSLVVLIVLPWLLKYVKSIDVGGVKIDLERLMSATDKIDLSATPKTASLLLKGYPPTVRVGPADETLEALRAISATHPNLVLVEFRVQIELRIRRLARAKKILNERVPLNRLIRALISTEVIDPRTGSGILEIVALGNQAAHNADVSEEAANWVLDVGPEIISQLDIVLASVENAD